MSRLAILGPGDIMLGLVLLLGAPARTSNASFAVIRKTGGPQPWGWVLLAIGTALTAMLLSRYSVNAPSVRTHQTVVRVAAAVGAGWFGAFAYALLEAVQLSPVAALTGLVAYGWFCVMPHLALCFGKEG